MDPSRLRPGQDYWDDVATPETEDRYDIVGRAFNTAGDNLVEELGEDETQWPWGRKHGFRLRSLLASLSSVFEAYSNPPGDEAFFANRGGMMTVDVANPRESGFHTSGPSTRFQCEGTDPIECTVQLPGGQSSHPTSDNYDDLLQLWLSRTPIELMFDIEQVRNGGAEVFDFRN
jgi:acyl-homoserine lactone acylase PvdQ